MYKWKTHIKFITVQPREQIAVDTGDICYSVLLNSAVNCQDYVCGVSYRRTSRALLE